MSKLTPEQVIDKKYLTDTSLAERLILQDGDPNKLSLDDDIIKDHIYQIGAYIEVYGDQEERDSQDDGNESNDIMFRLDNEDVVYTGKPTVAASTALKSLGITGTLYYGDNSVFNTKGLKATDLGGINLYTYEQYGFISYADPERTTQWGEGTVKLIERASDHAEVEVLSNEPETEFVGNHYFVMKTEIDPENPVVQLYTTEGEETGIWVFVYEKLRSGESMLAQANQGAQAVLSILG